MRRSVIPRATPGRALSRCGFLCAFPLLLALAACSGTDAIEGQASQWSDPPPNAHSFILVDSNDYPGVIRSWNLDQAAVTLGEAQPRTSAGAPSPGARGTTRSDAQGVFSLSTTNAPFRSEMVISAEHAGCEGAHQSFRHLSWFPHHSVAVMLVCRGLSRK